MSSQRRSGHKQQTRLMFSPLPSSSPAASDYPDQIHRRAAAVRYDQSPSPSKKRRTTTISPQGALLTAVESQSFQTPIKPRRGTASFSDEPQLPTPLTSSQAAVDDEKEPPPKSLSSDSKSQEKLTSTSFDRAKNTQDFDDADDIESTKPSKTPRLKALTPQVAGLTQAMAKAETDNRYPSDEDDLPIPSARRRRASSKIVIPSSDDDSDSSSAAPITPHRSRPKSSAVVTPMRFLMGGQSGAAPLSESQRRKKGDRAGQGERGTKSRERLPPSKRVTRSSVALQAKKIVAEISTGNENHLQLSPGIQAGPTSTGKLCLESKTNLADSTEGSDHDEVVLPKAGRKERQASVPVTTVSGSSESSEEDPVISPRIGRLSRKKAESCSSSSHDSANDLKDDLDDLRETMVLKNRTRPRLHTSERSKRQTQLEILKHRRALKKPDDRGLESDTDPAAEALQNHTFDNEVSEESTDSANDAIRQTLNGGQNLDEYDDDGFLDDEDATIGAPLGLEEVPLEFTQHSYKKPIEHFKDTVEWMIYNKLNPAFARHDPIYRIARLKLEDEVQGYSGSKFLSSAWNAEFLKALKARPELHRIEIPTMHDHKCDACNRSGHPAKYQLIFSGKPYDRNTLENLSDGDDEDDDEEEENTQDSNLEKAYYLGRTCAANAETAHTLYHWRNHLNQAVLNWLKVEGHISAEKIVEREEWSAKKREKYADNIIDWLETSGDIKGMYKEFKQNLDIAREARPERYTYGPR